VLAIRRHSAHRGGQRAKSGRSCPNVLPAMAGVRRVGWAKVRCSIARVGKSCTRRAHAATVPRTILRTLQLSPVVRLKRQPQMTCWGAAGNEAELSKTYPHATISRKLFRYRPSISSA